MGAWGPALFSDDLALDVKGAYRDLIQGGASSGDAKTALLLQFKDDLADPDTGPVVWLAFAVSAWKLGRLDDDTKARALAIIKNGEGLGLWDTPKLLRERKTALQKVAQTLTAHQPKEATPKAPKAKVTDWQIGEVIGLMTVSSDWTLLHVASHLNQGQDCYPVCELLDWRGQTLSPTQKDVNTCKVVPCLPDVKGLPPRSNHCFVLLDADTKAAKGRFARTGLFRTNGKGGFFRLFQKKNLKPLVGASYLGLAYLDEYLATSEILDR